MVQFIGSGTPLSKGGFGESIAMLGAAAPSLWAVLATETSGCGYLPDRRPKILFERHIFHRLTHGAYDEQAPDISAPTSGGYGHSGAPQYLRLQAAIALDQEAALKSASWGLGQILGENYADAGYSGVGEMVAAFVASEDAQLKGMAGFIISSGIADDLADKRWQSFALHYNGKDYAKGNYDGHLQLHCANYEEHGCPDIGVRAAQIFLTYRGYDVGGIDGVAGQKTTTALQDFQSHHGLPVSGTIDAATLAALSDN